MSKKICFVHPHGYKAFKQNSVGGTQLQLYHISTELAGLSEFDVKFISRGVDNKEKIDGVELIEGIGEVDTILAKLITGLKLLKSLNQVDADLYFSSNSDMDVGLIGLFCLIKRRKHIHRTVHERQLHRKLINRRPIKGWINHLGLRQADLVFTQCKEHARIISDWIGSNVKILPNSFPIRHNGIKTSQEHILWVGRRVKWKRPEIFIDLAEKFPNEKFIMISPRTSSKKQFYDYIEDRAREINNLELIERVSRDKIQQYYDRAKIFVNTSEEEGFPNTFIEAGKGSTPILSYSVNPDNIITKNDCGFVSNESYTVLKDNLEKMVENPNQTNEQGRNFRDYIETNHDIKKNIEKVKLEINKLI